MAPFAGMTQTGSMGLISAAQLRGTPSHVLLMMGCLAPIHKGGWKGAQRRGPRCSRVRTSRVAPCARG